MRRHPVEDHADTVPVQHVDQVHAVLRRAVARGRREVAGGLVAPRSVERMLGDRHQLHVGEAHALRVFGERQRDLAIAGERPRGAPPRAQVDFVDRKRRAHGVTRAACGHPFAVLPLVVEAPCPRGARRRDLRGERERIGAILARAVARRDGELVGLAVAQSGDVRLPDARMIPAREQHVRARIPGVPLADHRDRARVGRPHRDMRAVLLLAGEEVTAEPLVERGVGALAEEIDVVLAQHPHGGRRVRVSGGGAGFVRAWRA